MSAGTEVLDPRVRRVVEDLCGMISVDGGRLEVREASSDRIVFDLLVEDAECAECIMPREYLESLLGQRLGEVSHFAPAVVVYDPREPEAGSQQSG